VSAVLVDTGVFSAPLLARRAVGQPLQDLYRRHLIGHELAIAAQTLAELHYGAKVASWGAARCARLDQLVDTALIVAPDQPMCRRFGSLRADLRRIGHPLHQDRHTADLWIAPPPWSTGFHS
jgi:predicted nucleic acid-binding protein